MKETLSKAQTEVYKLVDYLDEDIDEPPDDVDEEDRQILIALRDTIKSLADNMPAMRKS